jgi:predicted permease
MITRAWLWLRSILLRARLEREMKEEMSAHLRRSIERFEASGMPPEEARIAAYREFGNVAAIQEEAREARGGRGIDSVLADLRYGARWLSGHPFSALTMIVVFALGIGFNAALFMFISSLVNSPVPGISRDDSLVRIRGIERRAGRNVGREFSYPEYRAYASQRSLFASVAAWTSSDVVLGTGAGGGTGQDALYSGAATYVTSNYFPVLGIQPIMGAGLPEDAPDVGGNPALVAVISHVVWERCFGFAPDVVGRPIDVNGTTVTIVGVAPRRFAGARTGGSQMRVWLPLNARPLLQRTATDVTSYDQLFLGLAARLQPGVEPGNTRPAVEAIAAQSMDLMATPHSGTRAADVVPMLAGNYFPPSGEEPDTFQRATSLMIPLLILLVTCTNVSALLAGLAIARRREIAVRLSLGAARRRIVRQLVTESVLLAVTAGALALAVIWILLRLVESNVADAHVTIDWRAVLFTLVVAITAGVIFGLSPALHGTRVSLSEVLKDSASGAAAPRSRLQSILVVAQIALTQPLLLGMGALILEIRDDLRNVPSPIYADRVLDVRFNTNPRYGAIDQSREDTLRRLQDRFAALPGVVGIVPQENTDEYFRAAVHLEDRVADADRGVVVRAQAAPQGYFALMGIPVLRGRDFDAAHREDRTAIILGVEAARRLWPGTDPIGRRLVSLTPARRGNVFTVVGVVDEARAGLRDAGDEIRVFAPDVGVTGHFLIRTQAPAQPMLPVIRAAAVAEAPSLPLVSARTLDAIESAQRTSLTRALAGIGGTGVLALFLSAIGLYAVVALAVRQRVREIGIRTALGADRKQVVRWFLFRGLRLSLAGMAVGLTLSVIVLQLMAALRGTDPPSGIIPLAALIGLVALTVALAATWIPARRAAAVDPLAALRLE